VRMHTYEHVS